MGKGRSWAGKGQGLLPAAHTSVVQTNQMPRSPPIPWLSDFSASNLFFLRSCLNSLLSALLRHSWGLSS